MRTLVDTAVEGGRALELWQDEDIYEVTVDGGRILSSGAHRAETHLAELAVSPWQGRDDVTILVAGLGMGRLVRACLDAPGVVVTGVDVVEPSPAIRRWNEEHFKGVNDPRVNLHTGELGAFLAAPRYLPLPIDGWFALILDVDARPFFHGDEGLALLERALRPGGVLTLVTPQRDDALDRRLRARLQSVNRVAVPVGDGLEYIYRGRRRPRGAN